MCIRRSLQATALVAAAVLLGLLTMQGTYALWSASASAAPGTVTAASFDMALTAVPSGQVTNMTLASGQPATLAITPAPTLAPGSPVYGGVAVSNNSNAGGSFNTAVTLGAPVVANVAGGSLAQYVTVSAKSAASATECSATGTYTAVAATGLASPSIAKGGATVFCFQVSLSSTTPSTLKGQAVNISLPLTARQLCGVPGGC